MAENISKDKKTIIPILGIGRSGTSMITRSLKVFGIGYGEHLQKPNEIWNPKGYFEDLDIGHKINRNLLSLLKKDWHSLSPIHINQEVISNILSDCKKDAIELLTQRFNSVQYWAFKEPRTVLLLSFWKYIFKNLELNDKYIIVLRNPLSSAKSYEQTTNLPIEHGLLLWFVYFNSIIKETVGKKKVIVHYDNMLKNPIKELLRIKNHLELPLEIDQKELDIYTHEFMSQELNRFHTLDEDLKSYPDILALQYQAYDWLRKISNDETTLENRAFLIFWNRIDEYLENSTLIFRYIDEMRERNKFFKNETQTNIDNLQSELYHYKIRFEKVMMIISLNGLFRKPIRWLSSILKLIKYKGHLQ